MEMVINLVWWLSLVCIMAGNDVTAENAIARPNIVFIVADDLGWDDVSFHGSDQILTPNIDVLAYDGVILRQYYTDAQGSASRCAFFTGKYPLRLGLQGSSIEAGEDRGIPLSERLLPAYLQELGYETHLIGKWHVGKSREHYTPTYRGFDTFYGFLGDSVDYFTFNHIQKLDDSTSFFGLDFFEDTVPLEDITGYLTDALTERAVKIIREHTTNAPLYLHVSHAAPHVGGGLVSLQPPADTIAGNDHIAHSARRLYAGLVTSLDRSVGHIMSALAEREMLENTLIVFTSDNGAPTVGEMQNFGSNLPLRGIKSTPWEGAVRAAAVVWHASLPSNISNGLFHVTDWLPTLVAAAGGTLNVTLDGYDQWSVLTKQDTTKRQNVLITADDQKGYAAYVEGDYKIIVGDLASVKQLSMFHGMQTMDFRSEPPLYDEVLLECETYHIFREVLGIYFDIDEIHNKRKECNLLTDLSTVQDKELCVPTKEKGCLFNITADPLESHDLWQSEPGIVSYLTLRLRTLWGEMIPRYKTKIDERASPENRNYVWTPWVPNNESTEQPLIPTPAFPLQVSLEELQYVVNLNLSSFKDRIFTSIKNMGETFVKSVSNLFF